jgi:hypothetical protein
MSPDQINQFFSFLYEGTLGEITWWLRLIAGILTSAMLAAIAVITLKFRQLNTRSAMARSQRPSSLAPPSEDVARPWQEVVRKIESPNPSDWNLAVIQADAMFDSVTKDMGLPGVTLGERLKALDPSKLASLNDVWEAHKIRNRIVHESDIVLSQEEARYAVRLFEKGLRELAYLPA